MIKTWRQRCEEHPDHNGIVSEGMIQARMQEEIDELRAALEQEPVAWVYPGALEAFKKGNPWVAYGSNGDGPYCDGVHRIPLYLNNDAVAQRVEPRSGESGAGFESLPASSSTWWHEPAAQMNYRKWQGLTDEEIAEVKHLYDWTAGWTIDRFTRAIEAKLKDKNS